MSMENAILEHAAALNNVAKALEKAFGGVPAALKTIASATSTEIIEAVDGKPDTIQGKAAELADATKQRAAAARDAKSKDELENAVGKDELENAVGKVETDAVAAQRATEPETGATDDTPLDYNKDVKPKLLAHIKRVGRDKVQALIKAFGVDKGDLVPVEKLPELLAQAEKLAA